ncbi:WXG100 family type VII secretion target [Nonomuraea aridisoli]|uniref:WXG100 family type VII secretion target n=1 Tax=Nonomuraea aridisoli TaxID=2070368 RepID=A0A2W2FSA6_9ACTN|nr:WXG100 family type VII secretion target [Nonomuraea aridisoli]PZG17914.1 hypothetical protein C1J01_16775 [Nonomuraea aridisoli]
MGENRQETHHLKPSRGSWDVQTSGRNVQQVKDLIKNIDAPRIEEASLAYSDAHRVVDDARQAVYEQALELAKHWEGPASVEAQRALQTLHGTLGELADKMMRMSTPLGHLNTVVRDHQAFLDDGWQGFMQPTWHNQMLGTWNDSIADIYRVYNGSTSGAGDGGNRLDFGSQDELAGLHLKTFGDDLQRIYSQMPDTVETRLRDIHLPQGPDPDPDPVRYPFDTTGGGGVSPASYGTGDLSGMPAGTPGTDGPTFGSTDPAGGGYTVPGHPGTGSAGSPGGPTTGTGGTPYPDGSTGSSTQNPDGSTGSYTHNPDATGNGIPGQTPTGGTDPTTRLQDHIPLNTATPASSSPTGTVPGYGNPSGSPYSPGTATGPGTYGGAGGVMPAGTAMNARGGSAMGVGMPFVPMAGAMGGAGGQESSDRESTTWLHEDDDVWGGDTNSAVNSRIG